MLSRIKHWIGELSDELFTHQAAAPEMMVQLGPGRSQRACPHCRQSIPKAGAKVVLILLPVFLLGLLTLANTFAVSALHGLGQYTLDSILLMALAVSAWTLFLLCEKVVVLQAKHVPVLSLTILAFCTVIPWVGHWLWGSHGRIVLSPADHSLIDRSHALYAANMVALALMGVAYCRWLNVNRAMWRCYCGTVTAPASPPSV
jgi:hypothetical protein